MSAARFLCFKGFLKRKRVRPDVCQLRPIRVCQRGHLEKDICVKTGLMLKTELFFSAARFLCLKEGYFERQYVKDRATFSPARFLCLKEGHFERKYFQGNSVLVIRV